MMSVQSLATVLSASPAALPAAAVRTGGKADSPARTVFAHILSHGKTADRAADQASAKPAPDKDDDKDIGNGAAPAAATADPAAATAAAATVVPDDLTAAADQGLSAVLALLGAARPAPAVPTEPAADPVADSLSTVTAAALPAVAPPSPDLPVAPAVQPDPQPAPADIASLSPADQQVLRTMAAAVSAAKQDVAAAAIPAEARHDDAVDPDISALAAALNRAFGKPGQDGAAQPAAAPSPAVPSPATPSPATIAAPPPNSTQPAMAMPAAPVLPAGADASKEDAKPGHVASSKDDGTIADIAPLAKADTPMPAFPLPATDATADGAAKSAATGMTQPGHAELSVTRHLDMLKDTQWLDTLAHDIGQAAAQNGHLKFQLNPEHLGSLAIEITNGAAGASIRMTTDNDNARAIIADAQPRLIAEVRAQGLRVADSHVDLGSQANSGGGAGQRRSSEDHKPFVRTQVGTRAAASDSPPGDDELYA